MIPNLPNSATFTGSGSTGPFTFAFPFLSNSEIIPVITAIDGSHPVALIASLTGAGTDTGGSLTLINPLPVGYILVITRILPIEQQTSLPDAGPFFASTIEGALDYLTMICQQLQTEITGGEADLEDMTLPWVDASANGGINAAVAAIGSASATLLVAAPQILTASLVIPANIQLVAISPGNITTTGFALTINGSFSAGDYPVFIGSGAVTGLRKIRVPWFGTIGIGGNDQPAFQAAVNAAEIYTGTATVSYPDGNYNFASTLLITKSATRLQSDSLSPFGSGGPPNIMGATFTGTVSGMGDVILVKAASGAIYNVTVEGTRINATFGLASPPTGIRFVDASECRLRDDTFSDYLNNGVAWDGSSVNYVEDCRFANSAVGMLFTISSAVVFPQNTQFYATNLNMYNMTVAHVEIAAFAEGLSFRDSWFERSPAGFLITPNVNTSMSVDSLLLDNVEYYNGVGTPYTNGLFIRAVAPAGATYYSNIIGLSVRNSKAYCYNSPNAVNFNLNGNSNGATLFNNLLFDNNRFYGIQTAAITSNVPSTSGAYINSNVVLSGFQSGSVEPITSGSGTWAGKPTAWTPVDTSGASLAFTNVEATYTLQGKIMTVAFALKYPATASGSVAGFSLPTGFNTANSTALGVYGGTVSYSDYGSLMYLLVAGSSGNAVYLYGVAGNLTNANLSGKTIRGVLTYEVQ